MLIFVGKLETSLVQALILLFLFPQISWADHSIPMVSVKQAAPLTKALMVTVQAQVLKKPTGNEAEVENAHSFQVKVNVPEGGTPDLEVGSWVHVTLPTVRHKVASARVTAITNNSVELLLPGQVQQLEGQQLKVELPLKSKGLYRIPFQAIYSPRGITTQVFILTKNSTAHLISVKALQVLDDGEVIVSSEYLKDSKVVVSGTDNLLSEDSIRVASDQKESSLD